MSAIIKFWRMESGASAVEYGLLVSLIAVTAMGAILIFGNSVKANLYDKVVAALEG